MSRRIHWVSWQPTPYHNYFLASLAEANSGDVVVHYLKQVVASHPWKTATPLGYQSRYCRVRAGLDWHLLWCVLREPSSFFVIVGWNHQTYLAALCALRVLNRDYAVWTDTPDAAKKRRVLPGYARATFLRWILRGAAAVMGTGRRALTMLQQMGAPSDRLVDFPFFPDLSALRRNTSGFRRNYELLRIISVGYLVNERKGHDLALRALAEALRAPHQCPVRYSIAGTGADEAGLRTLVRELDLEGSVVFLGWLEPQAIRALYRGADILLHPSPLGDPYPNAVLDAMAAGLVTLISDACGPAHDRVVHGVNGFVHRAGDVMELSRQLVELLDNPGRIAEMGVKARATAEEWPVERGVEVIQRVIGTRAPP